MNCILCTLWVNCTVCKLYVNKDVLKQGKKKGLVNRTSLKNGIVVGFMQGKRESWALLAL